MGKLLGILSYKSPFQRPQRNTRKMCSRLVKSLALYSKPIDQSEGKAEQICAFVGGSGIANRAISEGRKKGHNEQRTFVIGFEESYRATLQDVAQEVAEIN